MKIRIGHLEETLGTIESAPDGFRYVGNRAELQAIVSHLQEDSRETGDALLREILRSFTGYWWAQDVADDRDAPEG